MRTTLGGDVKMAIKIGIELEMLNITGNEVLVAMESAGANCSQRIHGYHGGPGANSGVWKMESDSSLTGYTANMTTKGCLEVISPILEGAAGVSQLNRLLTGLKRAGATVDQSCGTHISVGLNGKARWEAMSVAKKVEVANRIVRFYQHFQPVFDGISANCRSARGNGFIGGLSEMYSDGRASTGRYSAINLNQYISYGRIEFRQPGYTLDKANIGRWLKLINHMVSMGLNENHCSRSMTLSEMPVNVEGFATYLGLSDSVKESVRSRIQTLYNNHRVGRVERLALLENEVVNTSEDAHPNTWNCISCGGPFEPSVTGQNICPECE